jgi:Arc/MetJ family transcription regulator
MRITIELDEENMRQIQKITGQKKKSPAVSRALAEFVQQHQRRKFIERALSGQTDFSLTNEELEARDTYEAR